MNAQIMTRARASALFLGGAALCSIAAPLRAQTNGPLRIGTFPVENALQGFYAKDMGFFAKAGVDVDLQLLSGSSAVAAAVTSNAIDIGYSALDVLAVLHAKHVPIVVIASAGEYVSPTTTGDAALVLPADSDVRQAKDLNGKIIATNSLHSLSDAAPSLWIDQNGGDATTIKFVEVPFPAMPAMLDAHRIDAAFIAEPFLGVARRSGRVLEYGYDCIAKRFLFGAYFATPQWAREHPELVTRFAVAMHETAVWANKNPGKSGELLAKYTKIDPTVIASMTRAHFAEALTPALMQPLIDVSAKYNGFSPFPAQELLYERHPS